MTSYRLRTLIALLILVTALPLFADKRRAAKSASAPAVNPTDVTITGNVSDADTNRPVVQAIVDAGVRKAFTDAAGNFTLRLTGVTGSVVSIEVHRTGYETLRQAVTVANGTGTLSAKLKSTATVRVTTTTGTTYQLDAETAQWAFVVPLSGYVRSDKGNFCRENGSDFQPDKTELARFIGPGVSASSSACCPNNNVISGTVVTKTGENVKVFFRDSCLGSEVDFLGRDHATGNFVYLKMQDIQEIVFP